MRRLLVLSLLVFTSLALADSDEADLRAKKSKKADQDAQLAQKKASAAPDKSLAGDITRKKTESGQAAPTLRYDQFRLGVESQVASKRTEQIKDLAKIIDLTPKDSPEAPDLYFRMGELYWEESKYYFFQGNRKDDDRINAMNRGDKAGEQQALQEKAELIAKSKEYAQKAIDEYVVIVQQYKGYKRTDEVLYFLGKNLMEQSDDPKAPNKALAAYKRLVEKFPKSKYLPDAYLAFGEYYFDTSKGRHDMLEKALDNYKNAANYPENTVYAFALYKQGWCYFNMADYQKAMDQFKAVILYAQLNPDDVNKSGPGKGAPKGTLAREARNDFVRAYERFPGGSPSDAKAEFAKVADKPEDRFLMMKQLANLYYEDGKDKEAALSFNMLIKEKPLSPEAPGFQAKIVDCVLRAGNKKMTLQQVRQLVKITTEVEKSGVAKDEKDKKALQEARELSERTLSNLAVNWHNEAKKTRDDDTFALSSEVYSDYLTLFPDNPKAYDLRFFWAELLNDNLQKYDQSAEQYTKVLLQDVARIEKKEKPGKFMLNAAYDAILAYDEVVKKDTESGKLKSDVSSDPSKKAAIPDQKKKLLEACERYLKYVPKGDKQVEIAFKAAKIYYDYNWLDEAVKRFADIALHYPDYKFENGDRAGEVAANLVLDAYNLQQDFAKVKEWAQKFYDEPKLATGKFKDDLRKLIEQVTFKLANQLDGKKEFAKAGDAYLSFVKQFPSSDLADKALYNASIDYFQAHQLDQSIKIRKRIISEYPKSEFVPACIFANAEGEEAVADFKNAADDYEAYASGYERSHEKGGKKTAAAEHGKKKKKKGEKEEESKPKAAQVWDEAKAQISLYNAGVFREGLGQPSKALKDRERYLDLWPDSKDYEKVFLSIADLEEHNGQYLKTQKQLEDYEKKYVKDPNKVLMAEGRIATIYEQKLHKQKDAQRVFERIWRYYDQLPSKVKKGLDSVSLDAVGRAHYVLSDDDWKKYEALKLKWTKLTKPQELKATIQEKGKGLTAVQKRYTATVGFKAADPAICALYKIGIAYHQFADELVNVKLPKGVPPDLEQAIRDELNNQAQPVKDKAAEAFQSAVQKSRELDVYNDCSTKSLALLRDTYKPDQFPPMFEEKPEIKMAVKAQVTGDDILEVIEPVPVLTQEQLLANKEKAKALQEQVQDLNSVKDAAPAPGESQDDSPPTKADDAPPPPQNDQPAASDGKTASPNAPTNKKKSDEPEDVL